MNSGLATMIVELVDLSLLAALHGSRAAETYAAHLARVRLMVAEGRDPDPHEVEALRRDIEGLRARLHTRGGG